MLDTCLSRFFIIYLILHLIQGLEKSVVNLFIRRKNFHISFFPNWAAVHYLITIIHIFCNDSWHIAVISLAASINNILNKRFKAAAGSALNIDTYKCLTIKFTFWNLWSFLSKIFAWIFLLKKVVLLNSFFPERPLLRNILTKNVILRLF